MEHARSSGSVHAIALRRLRAALLLLGGLTLVLLTLAPLAAAGPRSIIFDWLATPSWTHSVAGVGAGVDAGTDALVLGASDTFMGGNTKLVLEDGAAYDNFGYELALSGDTLLVLAPNRGGEPGPAVGSITVFVRDGATWSRQAEVKAAVYAPAGEYLSSFAFEGVALSGDTALVSVSEIWDYPYVNKRWVYVFVRSGTSWSLQAVLSVDDPYATEFGRSLAVSGDTALVGAPYLASDTHGEHDSVYVLERSGTSWSQQAKLTPNESIGGFGRSLAFSGDTALVGGWQSAYVFTRSGTSWSQQARLSPTNDPSDSFGSCVALSGDTALIGAPEAPGAWDDGAAYVFARSGSTWSRQAKLTGVSHLGKKVALSGDVALVATDFAAGVYMRSSTGWNEQSWLYTYTEGDNDDISSMALTGTTALLGAWRDDIGTNTEQGSVYVFGLVRDEKRPTTKAYPASVKTGKKAKLAYRVDDPDPSCGRATVTLKIYRGTKLKQAIEVKGTCACNVRWTYAWKCLLPKGVYKLKVYATDVAGNAQSKVGSARLTVT